MKDYLCPVCKFYFKITDVELHVFTVQNDNGESVEFCVAECSNCGSFSIPEGLNQIAWVMEE